MLDHVHDHATGRRRATSSGNHTARLLAIVALAALATACSTSQPTPPPPPAEPPAPTAEAPAAAALATYGEFWRLSEQATAAPAAQDWQSEIGKVARGQALADLLADINNYASIPAHVQGAVVRAPKIDPAVAPTPDRVSILDCVDISQSNLVADRDGSILDDEQNQAERFQYRATVVKDPTAGWLVETTVPALTEPC